MENEKILAELEEEIKNSEAYKKSFTKAWTDYHNACIELRDGAINFLRPLLDWLEKRLWKRK